ncbi:MAG: cell division protein FtsW [Pseudomonadota bacterium]
MSPGKNRRKPPVSAPDSRALRAAASRPDGAEVRKAPPPPPRRMGPIDPVLAALSIALLGFGVVMVFSASAIEASVSLHDPFYYLRRQALFACAGLAVMLGLAQVDYHKLRRFTYPALFTVTGLMLLSVIGFGHTGGGAARWLRLGPVHIQPSEAAKLALILWLAYSLAKKQGLVIKSFSIGFLPHVAMAVALMVLCLQQPDFGSAVVLLALTFALLFVAGARVSYLLALSAAGALVAAWLVRFKAYRWERMLAWLNMEDHRQDLAYQPFQAVMGFGSGEWTGMGLGQGMQVLYLPKAHTDFIAAVIGEEFGFVGFACLCTVYLVIVLRGVRAALHAEDEYGSYIAFGISALLGLQALINLSVAMAILPTKGLTLPFLSYGGSSLLVSCAATGILLNISRPRLPAAAAERGGTPATRADALAAESWA